MNGVAVKFLLLIVVIIIVAIVIIGGNKGFISKMRGKKQRYEPEQRPYESSQQQYRPSAPAAPAGDRFCPNCGARTASGARFCPECGGKLDGSGT